MVSAQSTPRGMWANTRKSHGCASAPQPPGSSGTSHRATAKAMHTAGRRRLDELRAPPQAVVWPAFFLTQ